MFNSRLEPKPERDDPRKLRSNAGLSFVGSKICGQGFVLEPEERQQLITRNQANSERIFPYIGGQEVNTSSTQDFDRYVINFGDMTLEEAERWPDLIDIVREKVKPERENLPPKNAWNRDVAKRWWQFGAHRVGLYDAIRNLPRCLVTSRYTKHLCLSFQPTDRVFSEALYVFPFPDHSRFAVLQSRIHEPWARLLSSSLEDRLRYTPSDCFDNFPFPQPNPRTVLPELEHIGERLYSARANYMVTTNQGLTQTYNRMKSHESSPALDQLRAMHVELDQAVLKAYGWDDIAVPPFNTDNESFKNEVIDRLYQLNIERYNRECSIQG